MYAVYDNERHIIAVHDDKHVIEKYVKSVYRCHNILLEFKKVKKSSLNKPEIYDDLYLVRFADTYVQSGYLQYVDLAQSQFIEDDICARDILLRILEYGDISDKDAKKLAKAVKVLENILAEDREYTVTFDELKELKYHYDPYIYNTGLYYER